MTGKAKYRQVITWIQNRIRTGELSEGDKIESENEISAVFGISRQTVRHALSILEKEGILMKIQGSGTYVKEILQKGNTAPSLSKTVTIISTYIDGYIFPRILKEMVKNLEMAGYSSRIMFTGNHLETERSLLKKLLEEDSRDPLIAEAVMSGLPNPNLKYYRELKKRQIPILFFHSCYPDLNVPYVGMDDVEAGRMAAEFLISQGHKQIGGIFKADDGQGKLRYQGMVEALFDGEIEWKEGRICWMDSIELRDGLKDKPGILKRMRDCTGFVCYNDEAAHILTDLCQENGIRIPEDLSLVSIDNSELARLNAVPLTSVTHPMEMLGKKAVENILNLIQNPGCEADCYFKPHIEIRSSVCKIEQ